jgi:hypothetical protein
MTTNFYASLQIKWQADLLQSAVREYGDMSQNFATLDEKAQNTITTAGIFLAAVTAFLDQARLQEYLKIGRVYTLLFLGGAAALLIGAIVLCLLGIRVRRVPTPMGSDELKEMVDDLLNLPPDEVTDTTRENFLRDQNDAWRETLVALAKVNGSKARDVELGQFLLVCATIFLGILLVSRVITSR